MADDTPVTLKDLRASERLIERAIKRYHKRQDDAENASLAVDSERERHDALVERYRTQGR